MRRRITVLMVARLVISLGAFGLALALLGPGEKDGGFAERGLYGTLAVAFLATALYAGALGFATRLRRFAALQLLTDIGMVTSLVVFSGGADSVFSFLYLPITVYGAILFDRRGAYAGALLGSAGYGLALVVADRLGLVSSLRGPTAPELAFAAWGVHSGALLLVALLASRLSRDIRLAGERLDARTSDLQRLRLLHERTVESLNSGLLTLDAEGRVTSFNPEASRITGRAAGEAGGRELDELLPGATALLTGSPTPAPGGPIRCRLVFHNAAGEERHLGLASSVLRDETGAASGHVVIFQDVTEVVAMECDLRRSERLAGVGQLAADIAHEVRNPLAAISGSVEMLGASTGHRGESQERQRLMQIVLREIDRLDALITDFLHYARPAEARSEAVDLASLLQELVEVAQASTADDVSLEAIVTPGLQVQADPTQLRQVLWNLLANSQQAMPTGGRIRVEARPCPEAQGSSSGGRNEIRKESPGVEITVSDTGSGIAPENLERIFDPFFTTKQSGTGLGLATVHRIVAGHGGTVLLESEEGAGTTFRIRLPQGETPENLLRASSAPQSEALQ